LKQTLSPKLVIGLSCRNFTTANANAWSSSVSSLGSAPDSLFPSCQICGADVDSCSAALYQCEGDADQAATLLIEAAQLAQPNPPVGQTEAVPELSSNVFNPSQSPGLDMFRSIAHTTHFGCDFKRQV